MPMMIVDDSEFEQELNNSGPKNQTVGLMNPIVGTVIDSPEKGRGIGNNEVPESLRKIIGETSVIDGRQDAVELAKQFGISPSSVSAYSNGSTSTASYDKQPTLTHLNKVRERISKKARNTLVKAIDAITEEKLDSASPVENASVARAMSAIVKDMEPEKSKEEQKNGPIFIMYAPRVLNESHFETIQVRE